MKRTALFFSVALLLSGVSASAMDSGADAASTTSSSSSADSKSQPAKTRCAQFKDCMHNTTTCIKNHKVRSLFVGAAIIAVGAVAYKLYSTYKKNAEVEEVYEA